MRILDAKTAGDGVRLIIFMVVTTLATSLLVVTIGNITFGGDFREYKAVFSDATSVNKGDDVRIAGVRVGTVKSIELEDRTRALVTFDVDAQHKLDESTIATIRFRNLVGQRYIELSAGAGSSEVLDPGSTIPLARTRPALDLTVLFNGFKPLFEALSPDDINRLSFEIIQVFQGEGGTIEGLLEHTASVTNTLADRDKVIGALIDNLNDVLTMLGDRDEQLTSLITELQQFVTGLAKDRKPILTSLDAVSELATETAGLVSETRPWLKRDIKEVRRLAKVLNDNRAIIDQTLKILPLKLRKIGRTGSYGALFNFYLCHFQGRIRVGDQNQIPPIPVDWNVDADRCPT